MKPLKTLVFWGPRIYVMRKTDEVPYTNMSIYFVARIYFDIVIKHSEWSLIAHHNIKNAAKSGVFVQF